MLPVGGTVMRYGEYIFALIYCPLADVQKPSDIFDMLIFAIMSSVLCGFFDFVWE